MVELAAQPIPGLRWGMNLSALLPRLVSTWVSLFTAYISGALYLLVIDTDLIVSF